MTIKICKQCGATESTHWNKCCPDHTTEQGPDVICDECVEKLHPDISVRHQNAFDKEELNEKFTPSDHRRIHG